MSLQEIRAVFVFFLTSCHNTYAAFRKIDRRVRSLVTSPAGASPPWVMMGVMGDMSDMHWLILL